MSSQESYSDIEEPKELSEFTFTWSIHNYSYCTLKEDELLVSPKFEVNFLGIPKCRLLLYPRGNDAPGFITCYLSRYYEASDCNFTLSVRKSNGQFKEAGDYAYDQCVAGNGYSELLSLEELNGPDGYLVNDTLTLQCRIYKTDADIPASVTCYAHSRIKISKLDYTWNLNDIEVSNQVFAYKFNQTTEISHCFGEIPSLKMHVMGLSGDDAIQFGIEMGERTDKFYFVICVINLLDADGKVVHSTRGDYLFEHSKPKEIWNFPIISKDKLCLNKNVYLPRGILTLRCELGVSSDSEIEHFDYRIKNDFVVKSSVLEPEQKDQELWVESMRLCYIDGKFSDFILRTTDKQFSVHRAILSSHSEVFYAMFENDMKERKSGEVEIKDLDDDTVSKMLTFLYTNTLDDLDYTAAEKLYFAADKYGIKALQKKCSNHLMRCLDASNVCDILLLADTHRDQELKSRATDFIEVHSQEIIASDGWKKLLETNTHLTSEVLQSLFCKKFLNNEE